MCFAERATGEAVRRGDAYLCSSSFHRNSRHPLSEQSEVHRDEREKEQPSNTFKKKLTKPPKWSRLVRIDPFWRVIGQCGGGVSMFEGDAAVFDTLVHRGPAIEVSAAPREPHPTWRRALRCTRRRGRSRRWHGLVVSSSRTAQQLARSVQSAITAALELQLQ